MAASRVAGPCARAPPVRLARPGGTKSGGCANNLRPGAAFHAPPALPLRRRLQSAASGRGRGGAAPPAGGGAVKRACQAAAGGVEYKHLLTVPPHATPGPRSAAFRGRRTWCVKSTCWRSSVALTASNSPLAGRCVRGEAGPGDGSPAGVYKATRKGFLLSAGPGTLARGLPPARAGARHQTV